MASTLEVSIQSIGDVLHDDVSVITFHLKVVNCGDVGMVQTGGEPGLPLEGLQIGRVIGDRLVDDLDSHDPVQDGIPGPVGGPLTASGYPLEDLVSAYTLENDCREL